MKITKIINKKIAVYCSTPGKAENFINNCQKHNIQFYPQNNRGTECFIIRTFSLLERSFQLMGTTYDYFKGRDNYQIINCEEVEFCTPKLP